MTIANANPRVLKEDVLGRDILSRKDRRKIQKNVFLPSLFIDKASPFELSVNRLAPKPGQDPPADRPDLVSDRVMARISDKRAKTLGRTLYGWAVLRVCDAEQGGCFVRPAPLSGNRQHANIHLPDEAHKDPLLYEHHAHRLARSVRWRPRPAAEPPNGEL